MSPRSLETRERKQVPEGSAEIFAALGDETRLGLVARLAAEDALSIAQLTADTRVSRQAVTRHLEVLSDAGLVHGTRRGREHLWRLEPARLAIARRSLDQISRWWDEKLETLRLSVDE
jgi:DNA-binding transcriptional ArsR family regulator